MGTLGRSASCVLLKNYSPDFMGQIFEGWKLTAAATNQSRFHLWPASSVVQTSWSAVVNFPC
jgi:hypothetical protein